MCEPPPVCRELAQALAAADTPAAIIPTSLPCAPLDLLIVLHQEVLQTMLSNLSYAARAAAAAWAVVERFPDDPLLRAQAHWTQGNAVLYIPDYALALEHYDAALEWYKRACQQLAPAIPARDVRVVYNMRIFCLSELGRFAAALQAAEMAERWLDEHPNDEMRLTFLQNSSFLIGSIGDYTRMIEQTDAMIALALRLDSPTRVAQGWINRAYACMYLGRFAEADQAIDEGITVAEQAGETVTVARARWNRARLFRCQGHLFAALQELKEAERGLAQAPGEAATTALEESAIYGQLHQLPEAQQAAYFAAEQYAQQAMPVYSANAALRAVNVAVQRRQIQNAQKFLQFAQAQAEQVKLPLLEAEVQLADALIAATPSPTTTPRTLTRLRTTACTRAKEAIAILQANGLVQAVTHGQLTIARLHTQLGKRQAALALYRELIEHDDRYVQMVANAELGTLLSPGEGLSYLQRAAALVVEQRRLLPMEELQARYSSETSPYHLRLTECLLEIDDIERAVEAIWEAKAGPFLDLRAISGALDASTQAMLETAKAEIARCREQVWEQTYNFMEGAQQHQTERVAYHSKRLEAARQELAQKEQELTERVRTLGGRRGQATIPSVAEIQRTLPPDTVLLEYAQIDDRLVCFLVRSDQPPLYRSLGDYHSLMPLLDRWDLVRHHLMGTQTGTNIPQQIREVLLPLWELLLAPWHNELTTARRLLIAPWGVLHHVPWAALPMHATYLGHGFTLMLTPSGALWSPHVEASTPLVGPPRILGYASNDARHLDYVEAELTAIAQHLPDAQIVAAATAGDLRVQPAPRLLHIAAHALTNSSAPICSSIELADGPFLLLEAHRLDLKGTQLVVLSACETSVRPDSGDMALALAGAFLCAGADAVLASLWPVSDAATAALMTQFYAAFATGLSPDLALHQAQQQVRTEYPLDWAAFQIWTGIPL